MSPNFESLLFLSLPVNVIILFILFFFAFLAAFTMLGELPLAEIRITESPSSL